MTSPASPIALKMVRWDLEQIPEFALLAGFHFRWYEPGDEETWQSIHLAADPINPITPDLFAKQFGTDQSLLGQRQVYLIEESSRAIGTGTAWFNHDFQGRHFGRIHWLALLPQWQGRGLSKPLLSILCQRLRELGHDCAYLSTSSARPAAIRLYRSFGFVPLIENEQQEAMWKKMI